ncbi:hypothetical protein Tco_0404755 [Tanacetum coccineum]
MAMTIQYGVRGMILTAQGEAFKQENILAEILHGLDQQMERKGDENASLHVPLDEIKVDKTLRFVEEPVENSDREVKRLKCSRIVVVKAKLLAVRYLVRVSWNSKCNFELTWVWEDYLKDKFGNQSIERDRLNGIGFVLDFVEFISFTFGDKEMISVIEAIRIGTVLKFDFLKSTCAYKWLLGIMRPVVQEEVWDSMSWEVRIPLEGDEILQHGVHLKLELELLRKEKLYAKKGRVKLRRVRAMSMNIHEKVFRVSRYWILSSETSKVENVPAEMLRDLDQQMEKRADDAQSEVFKKRERTHRKATWFRSTDGKERRREFVFYGSYLGFIGRKSPVLWAEIGESSLTVPELVLDMTDKVVLIKEKLKAARDRQKSYADNRRKPLEFEVGDRVMLKVSPWKGVIRFGKKGKLAPRYVGPFEILERVGPVAYRLRLPEELSGIKVDKTLRFVEEPVENSDREVKRLKCSRMVVVKVHLGSKRVNQVTVNVNANTNNGNGNGGNGGNGNNGCTYKSFMSCNPKEYDGKGGAVVLTRWIERMETVIDNSGCAENQKVRYVASSLVNKALIGEYSSPRQEVEKLAQCYAGYYDEVVSNGTLTKGSEKRKSVDEPAKVGGSGRDVKKAKEGTNFMAAAPLREGPGHFARDYRSPAIPATPVNSVDPRPNQRACYKCGNPNHLRNRGGGNQVRGRAYNASMHAAEAAKDSSVVTEENPGYVIEIADGKKVKVDRIIRGCKLELGSSIFNIDLIPLGHGSFKFVEVFPDDLKGLPPQRQVEFRIELIPRATPVAKSPYCLVPSEMQELSEQLKELQDKNEGGSQGSSKINVGVVDKGEVGWMVYFAMLADCIKGFKDEVGYEYDLSSPNGWSNIRCAPFEALYGRKCRSLVLWAEIGESSLIGPELSLKLEDWVMLKVCLGKCNSLWEMGMFAPRYVGPFEILERVGHVAYRLRLPKELSRVHDTFHVSNLKKCLADASLHVPLDEIKVDKTLRFVEEPVEIMDREIKSLKRSRILLVKVRWNSKHGPEFTWEREDYMKSKYPQLFVE